MSLESVNLRRKAEKLAGEETAREHFGEDKDEKHNSNLESNPFIKIELYEGPLEVSYNVSRETTNDANDDSGDLFAKDMLCFAWEIARGMVSDEQLLL